MRDGLIENYRNLLFAIFNTYSDSEKGRECPIAVYDTKNKDMLIAIFKNTDACAKFFNTNTRNINYAICRKKFKTFKI